MGSVIFGLIQTKDKKLLIGTIGSGLLRFDGDQFEKIDKQAGMKEITIVKLTCDPDQNVWALGSQMNRLRLSKFNYLPIPATQGVYKIDNKKRLFLNLERYTYLEKEKAVTYSAIGFKTSGIAKDERERVWFTNWCEGMGMLEGSKLKSVLLNGKTNWGCFSGAGKGKNGEIWFTSAPAARPWC